MKRLYAPLEENKLFYSFHLYIHSTLFLLDDSKPVFSRGLKPSMEEFFFRKNHSGKMSKVPGQGMDVVVMYHNIDHINIALWDAMTGLILLRWEFSSDFKKMKNPKLVTAIEYAQKYLKESPKYTAVEIPLSGENACQIFDATLKI